MAFNFDCPKLCGPKLSDKSNPQPMAELVSGSRGVMVPGMHTTGVNQKQTMWRRAPHDKICYSISGLALCSQNQHDMS